MTDILYTAGMWPEVYDDNTIRLYDGACASSNGLALIENTKLRDSGAYLLVSINTVGLNGRDQGVVENGDWYVYAVKNPTTGETGAVLSRSITYGGVAFPEGFTVRRKLPVGLIRRNNRFEPYHLTHWPLPLLTFTDPNGWLLVNGAATDWTDVDCSAWIPDNARLGYFLFEVRDAGVGAAGNGQVRSWSGQTQAFSVGESHPYASVRLPMTMHMRVDSLRKFQYKVTPGSRLYARVLGYSMTEPS